MKERSKARIALGPLLAAAALAALSAPSGKLAGIQILEGQAAFTDYRGEHPGTFRRITAADLPKPFATSSSSNSPGLRTRPANAWPQVPFGFQVDLYASDLAEPRLIRAAPNGDLFVAETGPGQVQIFRGVTAERKARQMTIFASHLHDPFGIAFYPPGERPEWVYVGNTDSIVRFPYRAGDLKASARASIIIPSLPTGGHFTRDIAFSADGKRMFVSVGSGSNVNDPDDHPGEFHRADILEYTPDGKFVKVYASGIRNPVGIAVHPQTGELWCSVNERDALGDNLVPDYITHVQEDGFYGWPWYYVGANQDPRHRGKHPELAGKVLVPDVLLQPHNASLEMTFYDGNQFPGDYRGDAFAAEHGSWNRDARSGYEVVRVPLNHGHATGEYEDFMTGFVTPEGRTWGRPVGVAVGKEGSLYVTDDGSGTIWRVSYVAK